MPTNALNSITIQGFKSIASVETLALRPINVVIGANGSGKSNFLGVFAFLHAIGEGKLRDYVTAAGGAEKVLHFGSKVTKRIRLYLSISHIDELAHGPVGYELTLSPTGDDGLFPSSEATYLKALNGHARFGLIAWEQGREAGIGNPTSVGGEKWLRTLLQNLRVYHLNDTSSSSPLRKTAKVDDNRYLRADGSNLAAFLYYLREKHEDSYRLIVRTVQGVAPFFEDFLLEPLRLNPADIKLEWRHKESDQYFDASSLSDGTLRFIVLATLFLQPQRLRPPVIFSGRARTGFASLCHRAACGAGSPGVGDESGDPFHPIVDAGRSFRSGRRPGCGSRCRRDAAHSFGLGEAGELASGLQSGTVVGKERSRRTARPRIAAMNRLLIHVEGQTEEDFVNKVLRDHLVSKGYHFVGARIVGNARSHRPRGGIRSWPSVKNDILNHLREDPGCTATTMVDYYGLPREGAGAWPGKAESKHARSIEEKARCVQDALRDDLTMAMGDRFDSGRFVPFVVMHEFEGLLFSDCAAFTHSIGRPDLEAGFRNIRDAFKTPEEINDSLKTAPSKRIEALVPGYQKPLSGANAALAIGLSRIRRECPHFDSWLQRLESCMR